MDYYFIPRLLSVLILCYILVVTLRVLSAWFKNSIDYRYIKVVEKITDPYLSLFKQFKFLKTEFVDFTPIFAIMVLMLFYNLLSIIASTHNLTLAYAIAIIINTLVQTFLQLVIVFIVLTVIRFIGIFMRKKINAPVWSVIDMILNPVLTRVMRISPVKMSYPQLLLVTILTLTVIVIAGQILLTLILYLVSMIRV